MWLPQTYIKEAKSKGLDSQTIDAAVDQVDTVLRKAENIPSLLTLNHLATRVGVNVKELRQFVDRTDLDAYQRFSIRKRRGGRRFISIPAPQLMRTQRWINEFILKPLPVHGSSHAFERHSSIVKAASVHCGARWLIKIDVEDFFGSISEIQVFRLFRSLEYQPLVSFELARLCTIGTSPHSPRKEYPNWRVHKRNKIIQGYSQQLLGYLPQGAPSSPRLSNLIMKPLDEALYLEAKQKGLYYTRYSDDLCFSYHNTDFNRRNATELVSAVYRILSSAGYRPNMRKTTVVPPGSKKIVLGLNIENDQPRLSKPFCDKVDQHLYYIKKYGPVEHSHRRKFDSVWGMKSHIRGSIDFAKMVEPERSAVWLEDFNRVEWPV
ncbi:RNA-directed DNA polymerase [Rhodobacterales bacterium]|nr:RNA-directed DNA polymerase [Rhodobacterales bacterium]